MPPPPRRKGPPKKPQASAPPNASASTSGSPATAAKDTKANDKRSEGKKADKKSEAPVPEAPKPPTAHEIIGGKSWTGKLPVAIFNEHCQKMGWERVNYEPKRDSKGHLPALTIGQKNTKTQDVQTVYLRAPTTKPDGQPFNSHQPTSLEARHYAATYALHRVSSMKNIHMALPPRFRAYWAEFEEIKKEEVKNGKAYRYEADPFLVERERSKTRLEAEQARLAKGDNERKSASSDPREGQKLRGWQKVPVVDMGQKRRTEVEKAVRKFHSWNPSGVEIDKETFKRIGRDLVSQGFRDIHVKEALEYVKDQEEALEWLLIHVPEDDLPDRFLPENYAVGVTLQKAESIDSDRVARRLAEPGYSLDLCREVLAFNNNREDRAAEALMQILLFGEQQSPIGDYEEDLISFQDEEGDEQAWLEEMEILTTIYSDRLTYGSSESHLKFAIKPQSKKGKRALPEKVFLEVRKPTTYNGCKHYPKIIPTFSISYEGEPKLPTHVKLSITKQAAEYAQSLLGESMVFSVVDWVDTNIIKIADNPGPLRDVAGGVTGSDARDELPVSKRPRRKRGNRGPIDWTPGSKASKELFNALTARNKTAEQDKMLKKRKSLPAWNLCQQIVDAVNAVQVVIISGETGSGKSTQAVQFVLDDLINRQLGAVANIICTQPRRISALGLADRVSEERCGMVGQEIGYAIRGEAKQTPGVTKITFVTTGVLLRRLQLGDTLDDISHIVVDEVHERSLDTDFLLILLKRKLAQRKDLKVILMSATLDAEVFAEYFGGAEAVRMVNIEGRTFPVKDYYIDDVIHQTRFDGNGRLLNQASFSEVKEDPDYTGVDPKIGAIIRSIGDRINYNLVACTVAHIHTSLRGKSGGILIFLPGTLEILRCMDAIRQAGDHFHVLPLHASLISSEQRRVFPPPPNGLRKVICATNVAETSITIPDIVAVIDTGRVKETSYDAEAQIVRLTEVWASRAAAKQRRGRAGRVSAGQCYKLYTRNAEENKMPERPLPELLRTPLEQTALAVKAMGVKDVSSFLASALSPPASVAVEGALHLLQRVGATNNDEMTSLGRYMSMIPSDLRCSKLMIYGAVFGCLSPAVTIAAILTTKSPFVAPIDKREESKAIRLGFAREEGDLIADYRAWEDWAALRRQYPMREVKEWCNKNFLSFPALLDITSNRSQYLDSLRDVGFLPFTRSQGGERDIPAHLDRNAENTTLVRALVAGAFSPQIARVQLPEQKFLAAATGSYAIDPESRAIKYFTESGRVFIHPSSTLFSAQSFIHQAKFLAFFHKMASGGPTGKNKDGGYNSGKVYIREVTPVGAYGILMFGGKVEVDTLGRGITVDGEIRFRGWGRIGVLVKRLRALLDERLGEMIERSDPMRETDEVVGVVERLVCGEEMG